VTVPTFAHGDYPTHTTLNGLADALDDIATAMGAVAESWAVPYAVSRSGGVEHGEEFWMMHTHRYLHYIGAGTMRDQALAQDEITLSDAGGAGLLDLWSISWLYPGALYRVIGVDVCMEDVDP
jgi:hypothetical protein